MPLYVLKAILFYLGCLGCYVLQVEFNVTPVMAAATVGLIGSFVPFPLKFLRSNLPGVVYAGTFAGMCSFSILRGHHDVFFLSLIGTIFYILSLPYGKTFGGKLGVISFGASLTYPLLRELL